MKDEVDLLKEAEREKIHRLDALNHEHQKEVSVRLIAIKRSGGITSQAMVTQ